MFWVIAVAVAAVVVALGGGVLVRSWVDEVGGVPVRSPGIRWSLRAGVLGCPTAVALVPVPAPVPVRSVPGRCHFRCMEEVSRS